MKREAIKKISHLLTFGNLVGERQRKVPTME